MRYLPRPAFSARHTLNLCIDSISDSSAKQRLGSIADQLEQAEALYIQSGEQSLLYSIPQTPSTGLVTAANMKHVYNNTFVKSARTRSIYDQIKKLPKNDICPLCGQRTVGTLDHYLAQSLHSALAITPANLVPACGDCNKAKLDKQPATAAEQTLHPYFDNVDDAMWLYARVEEKSPAALLFFPAPPDHWSVLKKNRVTHHFQTFRLGALYASHSAVEINNIRYGLQRIAEKGTVNDIRNELQSRAASSAAAHINSWQTAMYFSLACSDWFCAGGFN